MQPLPNNNQPKLTHPQDHESKKQHMAMKIPEDKTIETHDSAMKINQPTYTQIQNTQTPN